MWWWKACVSVRRHSVGMGTTQMLRIWVIRVYCRRRGRSKVRHATTTVTTCIGRHTSVVVFVVGWATWVATIPEYSSRALGRSRGDDGRRMRFVSGLQVDEPVWLGLVGKVLAYIIVYDTINCFGKVVVFNDVCGCALARFVTTFGLVLKREDLLV